MRLHGGLRILMRSDEDTPNRPSSSTAGSEFDRNSGDNGNRFADSDPQVSAYTTSHMHIILASPNSHCGAIMNAFRRRPPKNPNRKKPPLGWRPRQAPGCRGRFMRDRLCDHCLGRPCVYPNPPAPSEAADETRTSGLPRLVQGHPIARRSMRRYYGYYPALEACHGRDLGIAPPLTTSLASLDFHGAG
jgi:hypothetical protein